MAFLVIDDRAMRESDHEAAAVADGPVHFLEIEEIAFLHIANGFQERAADGDG